MMLLEELPYAPDPVASYEAVAGRPWAVLLDSGRHDSPHARYDIVAAEPWATLVTCGATTELRDQAGVRISSADPFELVRAALQPEPRADSPVPFAGGAIGYFGYDLGRRIERVPSLAADDQRLPEMAIGLYDWALVIDHLERRRWLASAGRRSETRARWPALLSTFKTPSRPHARPAFRCLAPVRTSITREQYERAFARIKHYIVEGDCYQVNLAQRFETRASGDAWSAYRALRSMNPAPHAAYLDLPFAQIVSASPERFLRVEQGRVETRPIKGTRPRGANPRQDAELARELEHSTKDRAENVMIVDLLRNDLAKSCKLGSVRVPQLFAVESFANVHHLVSTVVGELAPGRDALHLLRGCFPGGSITGAPKLRAMQIIEELEPFRRGIYCGSIGYIGYDGAMDTNIAIRTLVCRAGIASFWAGGGIVADSDAAAEYRETLDKAGPFLELMRTCASADGSN